MGSCCRRQSKDDSNLPCEPDSELDPRFNKDYPLSAETNIERPKAGNKMFNELDSRPDNRSDEPTPKNNVYK